MDTITYYREEQCISVFRLKRESTTQSLGTDPKSDYVIKDESGIAPVHLKIKFELGTYQICVVDTRGMLQENEPLPVNAWFDVTPNRKLWLTPSQKEGYLIFRQDVGRQIARERARLKSMITRVEEISPAPSDKTSTPLEKSRESVADEKESAPMRNSLIALEEGENERAQAELQEKFSAEAIGSFHIEPPPDPVSSVSLVIEPPSEEAEIDFADESSRKKEFLRREREKEALAMEREKERLAEAMRSISVGKEEYLETRTQAPLHPIVEKTDELNLCPEPDLERETLYDRSPEQIAEKTFDHVRESQDPDKIIADRYRVLDILGKGGMGIVYKVYDEKLNREEALKLLLPIKANSLEASQRFLQEARAIAKLHHENIVAVHDIGQHKGTPYFTMDLIEGKEIQHCIKEIKPRQAMKWMVKVCEAIHYVHQSGIIHRDLKPSNIMICKDSPILMDFGIARDETNSSQLTADGQSIGTPAYMAPEQAKGKIGEIDEKTDVYGLGAILYEVLTGSSPFSGPAMQVLYKVCSAEPTPVRTLNSNIPNDVALIVEKAMSKEKSQRYQSAEEMAKDIRRYLNGLRIHAQAASWHTKMIRAVRRKKGLNYALAGMVSILLLTLTFVFYKRYSSESSRVDRINKIMTIVTEKQKNISEQNTITQYIEISDLYTQVLGIDSQNKLALYGKLDITIKMGDHACSLRDYTFARAMYSSALQMGIENKRSQQLLDNVNVIEKQEGEELKQKVEKIFEKLKQMD